MAGDRTVKVVLKGDVSDFTRALMSASAGTKAFSKELDSGTDRATNLTQSILALGPALVPIGAAGVPIIAGLTNQLGFAAAGAGVAALAFQGIGDALKATNDYAIEPTEANFAKMNETLAKLGPAGRDFVTFLQDLRPKLQDLQDIAQAGLLPGVEDGITSLMTRLPEVERIIGTISSTMGDLFAEAGANLADPRWDKFFKFLETEARPTLLAFGRGIGNLAEGFANLWMAFAPLSNDFSNAFLKLSRDFAAWTDGLDQTQGFQEFIAYIQENGPKAWDALAAVGDALLQIVEAAAPVGAATLPVITALSKVIATIADSDLGPIVIGVVSLTSALSRLKALGTAMNASAMGGLFGKTAFGGGLDNIRSVTAATNELRAAQAKLADNPGMQGLTVYKENLKGVADAEKNLGAATKARNAQFRAAGTGIAAMAFVMSDLDDKMGLTNTAMLGLTGSVAGPWGAAIGAGIGLALDFAAANDDIGHAVDKANAAVGNSTLSIQQKIAAVDATLAVLAQKRAKIIKDMSEVGGLGGAADTSEVDSESKKLLGTRKELKAAAQEQRFAEAGISEAMRGTSQATRDQTLALMDNIAKHNERANALLGDRGAMRNIEAAVDAATASVKQNGKTLDINTEKGRNNQAVLDSIAASYNTLSDGAKQNEGTQKRVRNAIIAAAMAMGASSAAAKRLARDLMNIPSPNVKPKVDLSKAYTQIAALKRALKGIKDEEVIIHIRKAIESGGGRGHQLPNARGSITDYYAGGGFSENHIAQIAPAGTTRVWNEPETKGESYIPLADDWRRPRALEIWAETGKRLGVSADRIQRFANGGSTFSPDMAAAFASSVPQPTIATPQAIRQALEGMYLRQSVDGRGLQLMSRGA